MMIQGLKASVDLAMSLIPRRQPSVEHLQACQLVAHRGGYDHGFKENTLKAFSACQSQGLWGLEFDVRWSKDEVPLVHHDSHGGRVFGQPELILAEQSFPIIRRACSEIPTLEEVIQTQAPQMHLMIELKEDLNPSRILGLVDLLSQLEPVRDFHFLSLVPERLVPLKKHFPKQCLVGVALMNTREVVKGSLGSGLGGVSGHFLLLDSGVQQRLQAQGLKVGTGFVTSKNSLYREVNRGADWIFTDFPLKIKAYTNTK